MEEEKNCKNCGNYLPHFVKRGTHLAEVNGHCVSDKLNKKYARDSWKLRENCAAWIPQKNKKAERRKTIKETLRNMEKSLEDIKIILQSDED